MVKIFSPHRHHLSQPHKAHQHQQPLFGFGGGSDKRIEGFFQLFCALLGFTIKAVAFGLGLVKRCLLLCVDQKIMDK
jgi:hypothetical protein